MNLYIGLMSGTSMDGIDAALLDVSANQFIKGITRPYSEEAKSDLQAVLSGQRQGLDHYSQLNTILGREFAQAALQLLALCNLSADRIAAIGSHGQTICHNPGAAI